MTSDLPYSAATDMINQFQSLEDNTTLVSNDGTFELGFFTPGSTSPNRYLGIWYKNIPIRTVVWVANRDNPIKDNSSKLSINTAGNFILLNQNNNTVIWSTNTTTKASLVVAQLLDSGNLVLRDEKDNNPENYSWQSFDYPSDTFLPGMKAGWDLKKGLNRVLTAWKNWDDPSSGDFTANSSRTNFPEEVMWKGTSEYYRSGPWDGRKFSGSPSVPTNSIVNYSVVSNKDEFYATYSMIDKSLISRVVVNQTLYVRQRLTWNEDSQTWRVSSELPGDLCDNYSTCGAFGICVAGQAPVCNCLDGFKPKSPRNWTQMNWNQGCVHNQTWSCKEKNKDGFKKFSNLKAPDTERSWVNASMTLDECKNKCRENCSCTAYANFDMRGEGSGCAIWFGDLFDIRLIPNAGQDLYIRLAVSETDEKDDSKKKVVVIASIVSSVVATLLIFIFIYWSNAKNIKEIILGIEVKNNESQQEDFELPLFDLVSIAQATDHFSDHNKLGEGGFGPVYKGTLPDGLEVAVKRLSQTSGQGLKEFKNEVMLCAKLQHRNLVKVLGCCIQENEKLLIYEYMANKSLDVFLFDSDRSKLLDWPKRFYIINRIARGLLYLHQDSRLRIIHRDLKASNVLLDNEMNPKISDFGLARMCGGDQIEGKTRRVVGTYGYMAPEYAFDGLFSIKSDVFSFGVLLLEIVSGKKNNRLFYPNDYNNNLIGHAWSLWNEGNPMEFIATSLEDSCILYEALRCIHIGLLCVQHHPNDRPNMASVVVLLSNENALPLPKYPRYLITDISTERESSSEKFTSYSINDVTISMLSDR
ncbi:G-type lectin S-receptor-like serine/threonine-protein kinase At4g27290 isoform X2 [Glycine soja]|uniref:Receptor-like serine/threonine-protein kinase n=1 Tax=Glycine soja TaxID=3848 RepID=A0A445KEW3_GLYSO|nr:G-type lectin S-receptor-like serine/threonine-protein kinase At4g27290 isoform X2 [Glycine soja]RZC09203.1 G-type lectin S-receptor-like serine/threonine-protein kinase isoform B [Glycine soja]